MANHSVQHLEKFERQIKEDLEKLLSIMQGTDLPEDELLRQQLTTPHRRINHSDLRLSVDRLVSTLKETRRTFGKG